MKRTIIKGDLIFQSFPDKFETISSGCVVITDGIIDFVGRFDDKLITDDCTFYDYTGCLVTAGLNDIHIHACQNAFRGTDTDLELLPWLSSTAFKEEAKFSDLSYARTAYAIFADELKKSATTRACVFATSHVAATKLLISALEESGLKTFVGKVNMDRNCPTELKDESVQTSVFGTKELISFTAGLQNTKYMLTPRFTPACTDNLMSALGALADEYNLPVQSHLSENADEIALVKDLCPSSRFYGETYDRYGLFGRTKSGKATPCVMAHAVHSSKAERALMKANGVVVAHSPHSNINLSSGVAPISAYLDEGINVGLATDVGAGHTKSMLSAVVAAVQSSKIYSRLVDNSARRLKFSEAWYMATAGGGKVFGKVGRLAPSYAADILVFDDGVIPSAEVFPAEARLERFCYLSGDLRGGIKAKFVAGKKVY